MKVEPINDTAEFVLTLALEFLDLGSLVNLSAVNNKTRALIHQQHDYLWLPYLANKEQVIRPPLDTESFQCQIMDMEAEDLPYSCPDCGRSCSTMDEVWNHTRMGEKIKLACPQLMHPRLKEGYESLRAYDKVRALGRYRYAGKSIIHLASLQPANEELLGDFAMQMVQKMSFLPSDIKTRLEQDYVQKKATQFYIQRSCQDFLSGKGAGHVVAWSLHGNVYQGWTNNHSMKQRCQLHIWSDLTGEPIEGRRMCW